MATAENKAHRGVEMGLFPTWRRRLEPHARVTRSPWRHEDELHPMLTGEIAAQHIAGLHQQAARHPSPRHRRARRPAPPGAAAVAAGRRLTAVPHGTILR